MAKKVNSKRAPGKAKVKTQKVARQGGLDAYAAAYARLLRDPCNGPLSAGCYPGAGGGIVSRFEVDFIQGTGAGETGAAGFFTPGYFNVASGQVGGCVQVNNGILTNDTSTVSFTNSGSVPGLAFLQATAKSYRCVAACLQVSWPGSELNRQGVVGLGQTVLSEALSGAVNNTSVLRTLASHVGRMPADVMEIALRPTTANERWIDPTISYTLAQAQSIWGDSPSLFWTAAGMTATIGLRVRLVTVVEWIPQLGSGINGSVPRAPATRYTLEDVLRFVETAAEKPWVRAVGFAALNAAMRAPMRRVTY